VGDEVLGGELPFGEATMACVFWSKDRMGRIECLPEDASEAASSEEAGRDAGGSGSCIFDTDAMALLVEAGA
jgi:hypothetical protein